MGQPKRARFIKREFRVEGQRYYTYGIIRWRNEWYDEFRFDRSPDEDKPHLHVKVATRIISSQRIEELVFKVQEAIDKLLKDLNIELKTNY